MLLLGWAGVPIGMVCVCLWCLMETYVFEKAIQWDHSECGGKMGPDILLISARLSVYN